MPDDNGNQKPGEPGHWRYDKDKAIEEAYKKKSEELAKKIAEEKKSGKDESGNPLPGTPGHWRFKKDSLIKKNGTTSMKTMAESSKKAEEKRKPKIPEVKKARVFTREELMAKTKGEQTVLINKLSPKSKVPKYEKDRVNLILELQNG